jgi:C4-dicarboxylate transporter DctM subunit
MFLAGVVPGVLMAAALMIAVYIVSITSNMPREERVSLMTAVRAFADSILALMTPIIIIGGIFGGIFTPTEAGVAASAYALVLSMFVYGEIRVSDLPVILWDTLLHTVRVMFVIASAGFFGWLLIHQRIPNQLIEGMLAVSDEPKVILGIVVLILLVLGMFLEGITVIILCVPLFLPVAKQIGVDPVQFGVIMIMCSMIGLLTPPVGMVLYAVSSVANLSVGVLSRALWPYLLSLLVALVLVTYWPALSLWLPNYMLGL